MSLYSKLFKTACAFCAAGLPGMAHAGAVTAAGTATFQVVDQCSVTAVTVNLGTFKKGQALADVAAELGNMEASYTVGNRGQSYLNLGTVNCSIGVPYTLSIAGTSAQSFSPGGIRFAWSDSQSNNYTSVFDIYVKSIGGVTVADSNGKAVGAGAKVNTSGASGIGTGSDQVILGSVAFNYDASMSQYFDNVPDGPQADTLSYTLSF